MSYCEKCEISETLKAVKVIVYSEHIHEVNNFLTEHADLCSFRKEIEYYEDGSAKLIFYFTRTAKQNNFYNKLDTFLKTLPDDKHPSGFYLVSISEPLLNNTEKWLEHNATNNPIDNLYSLELGYSYFQEINEKFKPLTEFIEKNGGVNEKENNFSGYKAIKEAKKAGTLPEEVEKAISEFASFITINSIGMTLCDENTSRAFFFPRENIDDNNS